MTDQLNLTQKPMGLYSAPASRRLSTLEWTAVGVCVVWAIGVIVAVLLSWPTADASSGPLVGIQIIAISGAVVLPITVVVLLMSSARSVRLIRDESQRLQAVIDHLRASFEEEAHQRKVGLQPSVEKKLDEIASVARIAETAVATFTSSRTKLPDADAPALADDTDPNQTSLALDIDAAVDNADITNDDLIHALHFPENADDKAGFAALRRALGNRKTRQVIQASQDILTMFAEDGIYMDDLRPDRVRPALWRRFSNGERGAMITVLGGIRDRSSLALTSGRMRQDPVFRDAAHHFLRHFDMMFQTFEPEATDPEIAALTDTRSARAFMLLGRVNGIFD